MPASAAPRRRFAASLVVATCIAAATHAQPAPDKAPTAVAANPPSLPASSAVLIVAEGPTKAPAESDAALQRRIRTHAVSLASEHNLRRLFTQGDNPVRRTQWFKLTDDTVERAAWLRDHVRVTPLPGTSLIEVALPDVKDANERKLILEEICTSYMNAHARTLNDQLSDRTAMLNGIKAKAESRLAQIRQEMQEKQVQLNINGGGVTRVGVKEIEISKLVGEQINAQLKAANAKSKLGSAQAAIQAGRLPANVDLLLQRLVPNLLNDEMQLKQADVRTQLMKEEVGTESAKYKQAEREFELQRTNYEKALEAARTQAKIVQLEELKADFAAAQATADSLNERVKTLKADLGDLSNAVLTFLNLEQEEKALAAQVRQVREQIEKVVSVLSSTRSLDVSWHLHPEATPLPPATPSNPAH